MRRATVELTPEFGQPFGMLADRATVGAQKMAAGLLTSSHHQEELPRQDFPDTGIAGVFSSDDENTTKSTTSASMFAECIYDHLDEAQLAELLSTLEIGVQR